MSRNKTPSTNAYWNEFTAATGDVAADYTIVAFGNTVEMADELAALVVSGRKRATAGLHREYPTGSESMPIVGEFVMVVDGTGRPRCIYRTTEVFVKPLNEVDDAFAWDEGEGDRTRPWWLAAHREYFSEQARREGFNMQDTIETVFERFEVVWPRGPDAITNVST